MKDGGRFNKIQMPPVPNQPEITSNLPFIRGRLILLFYLSCHPSLCDAFTGESARHPAHISGLITPHAKEMSDETCDADWDSFRLGHIADVEGNWEYFEEYVSRSNVLDWEEVDAPASSSYEGVMFKQLTLRPNSHFVYGGDVVDRGIGDIRLARSLVRLKRNHPDRVSLLVGNRDLNKLRLSSELSESDMNRPVDEIGGPFWDPKAPTLTQYLEGVMSESGTSSLEKVNTKVERLKYMLKHTLGCPETFEYRRVEIKLLKCIYGQYPPDPITNELTPFLIDDGKVDVSVDVSDDEVVASFEYEINSEHGSLRDYLNEAQIAAIVGNTIFVHGAIDALTMRWVPPTDTKFQIPETEPPDFSSPSPRSGDGAMYEDVSQWVNELNFYMKKGMSDFQQRPYWNEERTSRGGEALLAIQNRPSMWGRSVVCNSYADGGNVHSDGAIENRRDALKRARVMKDPLAFEGLASDVFDKRPSDWLLGQGIQRLIVGHKPTGDCPAVLNSVYTGVEIVSVDLSYAHRHDLENESSLRFGKSRGEAITNVEIAGRDSLNNALEVYGVLACGREYHNRYTTLSSIDCTARSPEKIEDIYLGRRMSSGWWVKARLQSGEYHVSKGSGRKVEYKSIPPDEVREDFKCK